MKNIRLTTFILFAIVQQSVGQTNTLGNWFTLNGKYQLSEKGTLFNNSSYRTYEVVHNTQQFITHTGYQYAPIKKLKLSAAYAYAVNSPVNKPEGYAKSHENRIWEQIAYESTIGRLKIENRARFEQRFVEKRDLTTYTNRYRYRVGATLPINNKTVTDKTFFIISNYELFYTKGEKLFDVTRFDAYVGYRFNKTITLQSGYLVNSKLAQKDQRINTVLNYAF